MLTTVDDECGFFGRQDRNGIREQIAAPEPEDVLSVEVDCALPERFHFCPAADDGGCNKEQQKEPQSTDDSGSSSRVRVAGVKRSEAHRRGDFHTGHRRMVMVVVVVEAEKKERRGTEREERGGRVKRKRIQTP